MVLLVTATVSSNWNSFFITGLLPMMPSKLYRSSSCARRYAFSDFSRRCSSADSSACVSSSIWKGLLTKSAAPRLMASTASFTVP